jgi:isopentenyl-diphosphate Delta-isomerase
MSDITQRKAEHLDIVLSGAASGAASMAGFDAVRFAHSALPDLDLATVDVSTTFLSKRLSAPLLISSMTGGPARADAINAALAEAAGALGIAFAVGSQRVALEGRGAGGFNRSLRARLGPDLPLLANFGAAQLKTWNGPDMARRALEMIEADALIIHLNPLQEALQAGGDQDWSGLLPKLQALVRATTAPVIVKEVGNGISAPLARRLVDAGITILDVAGAGGTSWAAVEGARAPNAHLRAVAGAFHDWGIPTARAIADVRAACPDATVIASGGIRSGVDVAKAIRLGANLAGQAAGTLQAALDGPDAVVAHFRVLIDQLRIACFCTASRDLAALSRAPLL